ncbi:putative G3BP-like protein isoform X1 [Herrania umbratica]|uniref:G3BP-like protein isoform X1 n=1 Tax=Herrania umbratica TaxID=108875 RepID=A0A6J0ZKR1_9ROSI|nr:putative G3BP-like protein isoform X1 [Herrania umbratica]
MASTEQQVPAGITAPTADVVGNAFVHQYYLILHQSPALVHRFYHDSSKLGRPEENGVMSITTTMQAINEKILSLCYGEFTAQITTVDAQDSHDGGVLVLVTGYLIGKDKVKRKFTQSFFLAPQDKGYFVLNDVFRYVDDAEHHSGSQDPVDDIKASLTSEQDSSPASENHIVEQPAASPEEANGPEVYNPSENGDGSIEEDEAPVAEVVDEMPDDSQVVADYNSKIEEVPKKSYASIVKVMKENAVSLSAPTHSPVKSAVKSHEQPGTAAPPTAPAPASDAQISSNIVAENGNNQDAEAEGPSIYVKGLPLNATPSMLENEFKKFGPIKSGGIQVRSQKGFCFGFVEFEVASAVQSAIEASPINIGGRKAVVEEKRSTSRGNKGRSSSGAGAGYRNEGGRGRGNYGSGRGYNRGEFGNRAEFGNRSNNRGGYSSRGGDGYQRGEHMGSNGGRVSRAGGLTVNAAAKNVAPRVSAPA